MSIPPTAPPGSADPRRDPSDPRGARDRGLRLSRRLTRGLLALSTAMVLGFSALAAAAGSGHSTPATAGVVTPNSSTRDDTESGRAAEQTAQDGTTESRLETNDDSTAITTDDSTGSSESSSAAPSTSTQSPSVTSGAS